MFQLRDYQRDQCQRHFGDVAQNNCDNIGIHWRRFSWRMLSIWLLTQSWLLAGCQPGRVPQFQDWSYWTEFELVQFQPAVVRLCTQFFTRFKLVLWQPGLSVWQDQGGRYWHCSSAKQTGRQWGFWLRSSCSIVGPIRHDMAMCRAAVMLFIPKFAIQDDEFATKSHIFYDTFHYILYSWDMISNMIFFINKGRNQWFLIIDWYEFMKNQWIWVPRNVQKSTPIWIQYESIVFSCFHM